MIVWHLEIIPIDVLGQSAIAIRLTDNLRSFKASHRSAAFGHSCARFTRVADTAVAVLHPGEFKNF